MSAFCMDFDAVHRDNLALYSKLFEENPYTPQNMDIHEVLSSTNSSHHDHDQLYGGSSSSSSRVLNNLDHHYLMVEGSSSSSSSSSIFYSTFYDPFDPFQASFGKLNQEFSTPTAPNNYLHMHGSQSRKFIQTMDNYRPFEYVQSMSASPVEVMNEKDDPCLIFDDKNEANFQKNSMDHGVKNKSKDHQPAKRKRIIDKKSEIIKGQWTPEEDRLLVELVEKHGVRKWSSIAQMLPGRIGKQCRERWHNHLKPNIKKDRWSEEEDRVLIEAHRQLGNRWAEIARSLPGRSENTIKNHWNATKRRQLSSRKNNTSSKSNSPLQNYIKSVMSSTDDKGSLDNSSSSTSASATGTTIANKPKQEMMKSCSNLSSIEKQNTIGIMGDESFKLLPSSLDPHMHIQFDLQKEMDFMEMLSYGYI